MAGFDLSQLFGSDAGGGLLSPQQQGDVNQQGMMGMAAALLKAAGPSPYKGKMTTLSGIGDALQGGLAARKGAFDDILKQQYVAAQTGDKAVPLLKMLQEYQLAGQQPPPQLLGALNMLKGLGAPRMGAGAPGPMAQAQPSSIVPGPAPNLEMETARKMGLNPMGVVMRDPVTTKAIQDHIAATDPAISANEAQKEAMKSAIDTSAKQYEGLSAGGRLGLSLHELTGQARALMADPDFKPGMGSGPQLLWNQFLSRFGRPEDQDKAFSMEVFNKITSESIQAQIEAAKAEAAEMGQGAGRVFQKQIDLYGKSSANLDLSKPGSRYLLEQMDRTGLRNAQVADLASRHMLENGSVLGPKWDIKEREFMRQNPLYSPREQTAEGLRGIATGQPPVPAGPSNGPSTAPQPGAPAAAAPTKIIVNKDGHRMGLVNNQWVPL